MVWLCMTFFDPSLRLTRTRTQREWRSDVKIPKDVSKGLSSSCVLASTWSAQRFFEKLPCFSSLMSSLGTVSYDLFYIDLEWFRQICDVDFDLTSDKSSIWTPFCFAICNKDGMQQLPALPVLGNGASVAEFPEDLQNAPSCRFCQSYTSTDKLPPRAIIILWYTMIYDINWQLYLHSFVLSYCSTLKLQLATITKLLICLCEEESICSWMLLWSNLTLTFNMARVTLCHNIPTLKT